MTLLGVDLWKEVQQKIVGKIGSQRFNLWLKNTTLRSLKDNIAEIGVPNPFILTWIEEKLAGEITEALRETAHRDISPKFVIDGSLFRRMRSTQAEQQDEAITIKTPDGKTYTERESLNPRYTFDRYAVGENNRFAREMALQAISVERGQFNTLLIYGGPGLGKSHLLQACARELMTKRPDIKARYVTCEQFVNRYVTAIRLGRLDPFRRKHREIDVLIIDDIHWLAGKKASQEEFLHTFNALTNSNKIVIAASDSHLSQVGRISTALSDRFSAAMTARIDPPDRKTRIEIARRRAAEMKQSLNDSVVEYVADVCQTNVRELEGALLKLLAFQSLSKGPLTKPLAQKVLEEDIKRHPKRISMSRIRGLVGESFGISAQELCSSRRTRSVTSARQAAMYLARELTTCSLKEVGAYFGNKSHATALHAEVKIREAIKENPALDEQIKKIAKQLISNET